MYSDGAPNHLNVANQGASRTRQNHRAAGREIPPFAEDSDVRDDRRLARIHPAKDRNPFFLAGVAIDMLRRHTDRTERLNDVLRVGDVRRETDRWQTVGEFQPVLNNRPDQLRFVDGTTHIRVRPVDFAVSVFRRLDAGHVRL